MMSMNRWGFYAEGGAIYRDWRSSRLATSSSPLGLGRGEMKKTVKKAATKKNETAKRDAPIVIGGAVLSPREHDDLIGRDPRSVR